MVFTYYHKFFWDPQIKIFAKKLLFKKKSAIFRVMRSKNETDERWHTAHCRSSGIASKLELHNFPSCQKIKIWQIGYSIINWRSDIFSWFWKLNVAFHFVKLEIHKIRINFCLQTCKLTKLRFDLLLKTGNSFTS